MAAKRLANVYGFTVLVLVILLTVLYSTAAPVNPVPIYEAEFADGAAWVDSTGAAEFNSLTINGEAVTAGSGTGDMDKSTYDADDNDVVDDADDAELLDGVDSTGFSLTGHAHSKTDVSDLETITATPTALAVPKAAGNGKIDLGWIADMTGATSGANGTRGLVPQPDAGEENYYLRGDGTWYNVGTVPSDDDLSNNRLTDIGDVDTTGIADGDGLLWDADNLKWILCDPLADATATAPLRITGDALDIIGMTYAASPQTWTFSDSAANTLLTIQDGGTTGILDVTGNVTIDGTLTVGGVEISGDGIQETDIDTAAEINAIITDGNIEDDDLSDNDVADIGDVDVVDIVANDLLVWDAGNTKWVTAPYSGHGATLGFATDFFFDETAIIGTGTNNAIEIETLATSPMETQNVESISCANNTVRLHAYRYTDAMNQTSLPAGVWNFTFYGSVNSVAGGRVSSIACVVYHVDGSGDTGTTTGSGTSRTFDVQGTGIFAAGDANADQTLCSYVETPQGLYPISAHTDGNTVTITTPTTYANEAGVDYLVWRVLFDVNSGTITNTGTNYQPYEVSSYQDEFTGSVEDRLGVQIFGISNNTTTVYFVHGGTDYSSHFSAPFGTLHNDLGGLQGGSAGEYYHLTAAEQGTISGLGTVATYDVDTNNTVSNGGSEIPTEDDVFDYVGIVKGSTLSNSLNAIDVNDAPAVNEFWIWDSANWVPRAEWETIDIPASAFYPESTAGCGAYEMAMGVAYQWGLPFDKDTDEYAFANVAIPADFPSTVDAGEVIVELNWGGSNASTNKVDWTAYVNCIGDGDAIPATEAQFDFVGVANAGANTWNCESNTDLDSGSWGAETAGMMTVRVVRDANDATNDTYAYDAWLLGVTIHYKKEF